jgi:hypothetical protein
MYKLGQKPVFPIVGKSGFCTAISNVDKDDCSGISSRLYLAGMALQGLLSNPNIRCDSANQLDEFFNELTRLSFKAADTLLKKEFEE